MWSHSLDLYTYDLPDERIAKFPLQERDRSKLLRVDGQTMSDHSFKDLPGLLPQNALLTFNNTRVIPARLTFFKETGARIEIFCLEPHQPSEINLAMSAQGACEWKCMLGNAKRFKPGSILALDLGEGLKLEATRLEEEQCIRFNWNQSISFSEVLECAGKIPLPPYLNRQQVESDNETYQTVYAAHQGAVAAPTAGLHFTPDVLSQLEDHNIGKAWVTLHVGAGTFQPVKVDDVREHNMHGEHFVIERAELERIAQHEGPIIPVGTTSLRTLESAFWLGARILAGNKDWSATPLGKLEVYSQTSVPSRKQALEALLNEIKEELKASTEIMIMPGYRFQMADALVTNFHQPSSTLIMLVAALMGDRWRAAYDHALKNGYRFLSYGDSSLLIP